MARQPSSPKKKLRKSRSKTTTAGKVRRGRPPKNTSILVFSAETQKPLKKKKVGRPRKIPPSIPADIAPVKKTPLQSVGDFFRGVFRELVYPFYYIFRYHFIATFLSLLFTAFILFGAAWVYDLTFKDLPSVTDISTRKQPLTTRILDRNGELLYRIYEDENRTLIPFEKIPPQVKYSTIAIEDRDFYHHHGISIKGILRAFLENSQGGNLQGGSTITQQLIKNRLLSPERTTKRKVREILLAIMMERAYTKDEILEMYLNEVAYGGSTYGIEEAAQQYFGKSATELSLAEASYLAGLPVAPSAYSPFSSTPELGMNRQREVLRRMVEDGYITETQAEHARQIALQFRPNSIQIQAPHFVMYVKNLLAKEYGENIIAQGGLEVRTTLDLTTQKAAQQIVTSEMQTLAPLKISNGAALITNPKTGEILAMVGSKDYFDFEHDGQVNVTDRPRQPGSSIKPITYALALMNGLTPSSTIEDTPVTFSVAGSPPYSPKNYDGRYHGRVSLREALASSYNIPAVKTLASLGISKMIDLAESMGISTWKDRNRFGLSLTLGGGEVLMTDIVEAYGTFATYGTTVELNPILEVRNSKGELITKNSCAVDHTNCPVIQSLDSRVSYQITDILSDNQARTPAFGPNSVLKIPDQQVAVKTGTTNNLRDNWTIGYTQDRVVAVWVGNNDNSPMSYVASGITGASPIWNKIMRTQLDPTHPHQFPVPPGLVKVSICTITNTLPCQGCPSVKEELFTIGSEPLQSCTPEELRDAFKKVSSPMPHPTPSLRPVRVPTRDRLLNGVNTQSPTKQRN